MLEAIEPSLGAAVSKDGTRGGNIPKEFDLSLVSLPFFWCWDIDPTLLSIALNLRVEDRQLAQPICELRILGYGIGRCDRSVEPPEDLLERVVIALTVAARQVREAASSRLQQGGILYEDLIAGIAMT